MLKEKQKVRDFWGNISSAAQVRYDEKTALRQETPDTPVHFFHMIVLYVSDSK